jgi:hypothetical protein
MIQYCITFPLTGVYLPAMFYLLKQQPGFPDPVWQASGYDDDTGALPVKTPTNRGREEGHGALPSLSANTP